MVSTRSGELRRKGGSVFLDSFLLVLLSHVYNYMGLSLLDVCDSILQSEPEMAATPGRVTLLNFLTCSNLKLVPPFLYYGMPDAIIERLFDV